MLKFNPDKCKVLSIGKRNLPYYSYVLCDIELCGADKEKDIGVVIDNELTFEDHLNEKINKANSILGIIRRTFMHLAYFHVN